MSGSPTYLVIGSGSIARRHIANIKVLYGEVQVGCTSASGRSLSLEEVGADLIYKNFDDALKAKPTLAIVASPAPMHITQAAALLKAGIPVLIEKPLSDSLKNFSASAKILEENSEKVEIAYNLRYMPSAIQLKKLLEANVVGHIHRVTIDVGQYLPDWRPATDYRHNVSARRELGGGVLLELSHELDYLTWFFGGFEKVYCVASTSGTLDIDVEDSAYAILTRSDGLVASLHMDFLQRTPARTCKIVGDSGTLIWDLLRNTIVTYNIQGEEEIIFSDPGYNRNNMYLDEISRFVKVARGELKPSVDIYEALKVLNLIEAMKYSSKIRQVVDIRGYL